MDEQQGNFKVTDRRLFNADGSPREVPPEERPAPEPAKTETAPKADVQPAQATTTTEPTSAEAPASLDVEDDLDREPTPEEVAAARDPASFVNFLMSIASNAASALGMTLAPSSSAQADDPVISNVPSWQGAASCRWTRRTRVRSGYHRPEFSKAWRGSRDNTSRG